MGKNSLGDQPEIVNLFGVLIRFAATEREQQHLTKHGYQHLQTMIKRLAKPPRLTVQQRRCLALLLQGHTPKAIAKVMQLDAHTIRRHLAAVRRKFSCNTNTDLVLKAGALCID